MNTDLKSFIDLIKYPILTEKTIRLLEQNQYSFAVDKRADKVSIKTAVEKLFDGMNGSSAPAEYSVDEFKLTGLKFSQGKIVDAPFVKESPAALECKYWKTIDLPGSDRAEGLGTYVVFGKVLGIYIDDNYIIDGLFDASKARPLVRLGYMNYGVVGEENTFTKNRPELDENGNLKEVKEWDGVYR